jgi:hypothetical protein
MSDEPEGRVSDKQGEYDVLIVNSLQHNKHLKTLNFKT